MSKISRKLSQILSFISLWTILRFLIYLKHLKPYICGHKISKFWWKNKLWAYLPWAWQYLAVSMWKKLTNYMNWNELRTWLCCELICFGHYKNVTPILQKMWKLRRKNNQHQSDFDFFDVSTFIIFCFFLKKNTITACSYTYY